MRGEFEILLEQPRSFERMAVRRAADGIFLSDHAFELFAKAVRVQKVAHANSAPRHFVLVGGSDAARRGADGRGAARRFRSFVHFAMIRKNQVRTAADKKPPAYVDVGLLEVFELVHQRGRINDGSRPYDGFLSGAQNAARNQLKNETTTVEDDGVTGVVTPGVARDLISRRGKIIANLAVSFVAPLRADDCDRLRFNVFGHVRLLRAVRS